MKKISIITVCYNSEATIRDTIDSVASQDYPNIEHVLIDGGSTDKTIKIINEHINSVAHFISEPDNGLYDAMNKGIRIATGEIIGILNSDDILASNNQISSIIEAFTDDTDATYGDITYFDTKDPNAIKRYYSSKGFSFNAIRYGRMIPHPTFYSKKSLYEKHGYYKTDYRVSADFELIARFAKAGVRMKRIPQVIVKMRNGGLSTTGFWWRIHQNIEIVRACKENGIYTNLAFLSLKIPSKLLSYIKRA